MKVLTALTLAAGLVAGVASADAVDGRWKTAASDTGAYVLVDIGPCGSKICGVISKVVGGDNSIKGRAIIKNMTAKGGSKYSGGTIWAPDEDKTYKAKMQLLSANTLKVSGCVAGGLICRGQNWTRVK